MKHEDDLSGKEFGYWLVLELAPKDMLSRTHWFCKRRKCGGVYIVRQDNLKSGKSTKCACCGLNWKHHRRKVVIANE